jgi:hypothetical protein
MLSREDKDWISALLKASEERTASLIATEVGNLHSAIVRVELVPTGICLARC